MASLNVVLLTFGERAMRYRWPALTAAVGLAATVSYAQEGEVQNVLNEQLSAQAMSYSATRVFPDQLLWGDTHLHTKFSFDAGMVGNRLGPDEAYRFAAGETVTSSTGVPARLRQPLDFLAVSDHAESLGLAPAIAERNPLVLEDANASRMLELIAEGRPVEAFRMWQKLRAGGNYVLHRDDLITDMWQRLTSAAERHYRPGAFTTLIGYEYTSAIQTNNLHRVVLLRDGAEQANKVLPFSTVDSPDPEDLWDWLDDYETTVGGRAMAIAHNGNLSNGMMFSDTTVGGAPISREYAQRRQRFEPLYEVTQIKGDGEAHPLLSPDDEFADFWTWDRGNFGFARKTPEMLPSEYARAALKRGLGLEQSLGVNPFKFGLIGSTDSHTSLATAEEDNFFSKATPAEPNRGQTRYEQRIIQKFEGYEDVSVRSYESAAAGLVAVWAEQNTREAIFDALYRKEVYATTGPRIALRFFGGFNLPEDAHLKPDLAKLGYELGVPMGGDLPHAKTNTIQGGAGASSPRFTVVAARDPLGANLDRVQIVKGWVDAGGETHERVFDVAWSGDRVVNEEGRLPGVGSTVTGATYTNSIGAAQLALTWEDPNFDPAQRAFWYVRVLEIPTPTWLAYDKAHFGDLITLPEGSQLVHQERAYSSPIWYTPE